MTDTFIQMSLALALVIVMIFALGYMYKKKNRGSGLITLLAWQPFGQKMGVAALKIGGEVLILGVTPTDFKLLKKMDEKSLEPFEPAVISEKISRLKKIKEGINA